MHLFLNNSAFDGGNSAISPEDDNAIADDKIPLRQGIGTTFSRSARYSNYSNHSEGINGLHIDVQNLAALLV